MEEYRGNEPEKKRYIGLFSESGYGNGMHLHIVMNTRKYFLEFRVRFTSHQELIVFFLPNN